MSSLSDWFCLLTMLCVTAAELTPATVTTYYVIEADSTMIPVTVQNTPLSVSQNIPPGSTIAPSHPTLIPSLSGLGAVKEGSTIQPTRTSSEMSTSMLVQTAELLPVGILPSLTPTPLAPAPVRTFTTPVIVVIVGAASMGISITIVGLVMLSNCNCNKRRRIQSPKGLRRHQPIGQDHFVIVSNDDALSQTGHPVKAREERSLNTQASRRCDTIPRRKSCTSSPLQSSKVEVYQLSLSVEEEGNKSVVVSNDNGNEGLNQASSKSIISKYSMSPIMCDQLTKYYYKTLQKVRNGVMLNEAVFVEPVTIEKDLLLQLKSNMVTDIAEKNFRVKEDASSLPSSDRLYMPGTWKPPNGKEMDITVKTACLGDVKSRLSLLQEAATLSQFSHPNVIKLIGVTAADENVKLILEMVTEGGLKNVLTAIKDNPPAPCTGRVLLGYSQQIGFGLHYLSSIGFTHGELKTEHICFTAENILKITNVEKDSNRAHSHKSTPFDENILSYGRILYEIWSLGQTPFDACSNEEVLEKVRSGYCLPPIIGCPRAVYSLMIQCWHNINASSRLTFNEIIVSILKSDCAPVEDEHTSNLECKESNEDAITKSL